VGKVWEEQHGYSMLRCVTTPNTSQSKANMQIGQLRATTMRRHTFTLTHTRTYTPTCTYMDTHTHTHRHIYEIHNAPTKHTHTRSQYTHTRTHRHTHKPIFKPSLRVGHRPVGSDDNVSLGVKRERVRGCIPRRRMETNGHQHKLIASNQT
jgi:hypothetical protein